MYPNPGTTTPIPPGLTAALTPGIGDRRWDRARRVRTACTLIHVTCVLFAVVLVAQIVMVIGDANAANGVATLVRGWSATVSLGFDDLFTPSSQAVRTFLNNGLAAIVWLGLGAVTTALIRRLTLPGPGLPR